MTGSQGYPRFSPGAGGSWRPVTPTAENGVPMNSRTITLTADCLDSLRTGVITVRATDSDNRQVVLFPEDVWNSPAARPRDLIAVLAPADLDLIETDPVGLVVEDTTGTTGWKIRMETP